VLQENIIIRVERGGTQGDVTVSNSTDDSFADLSTHEQPFDRIVFPDDRSILFMCQLRLAVTLSSKRQVSGFR